MQGLPVGKGSGAIGDVGLQAVPQEVPKDRRVLHGQPQEWEAHDHLQGMQG